MDRAQYMSRPLPNHTYSPQFLSGLNGNGQSAFSIPATPTKSFAPNTPPSHSSPASSWLNSSGSSSSSSPPIHNPSTPPQPKLLRAKHSAASLAHSLRSSQSSSVKSPVRSSPEGALDRAKARTARATAFVPTSSSTSSFTDTDSDGSRPPKLRATLGPLMNRKLMRDDDFMPPRRSFAGLDRPMMAPTPPPMRPLPELPGMDANGLLTPPHSAPKKSSLRNLKLGRWLSKKPKERPAIILPETPPQQEEPFIHIVHPAATQSQQQSPPKPKLRVITDFRSTSPFPRSSHSSQETSPTKDFLTPYPSSGMADTRARVESSVFEFKAFETGPDGTSCGTSATLNGNGLPILTSGYESVGRRKGTMRTPLEPMKPLQLRPRNEEESPGYRSPSPAMGKRSTWGLSEMFRSLEDDMEDAMDLGDIA